MWFLGYDMNEPNIDIDAEYISVPVELIKAIAHIGIYFDYGEYKLEQKWIDLSRRYYESTNEFKNN